MDDDIQFLGMVSPVSAHKPSYPHPSHHPMHPPASGIMLVIPKSGDEPTQTLRFLKSRSAVVHIGRASSSLADADKSPDSIQFRCPVISRRHAKLMFSSGHVYIVDLHSHHGTHLLRRDEIVSRPIVPDVPIALQDGDTLTFGRAVGKEPFCVSPVTANVMLIYDTETVLSPPISQPVISLVDSPSLPATLIKGKEAEAPKAPNPGRYGLFGPQSSPSSQSSPGSSDEDFSLIDPDGEEDEEDEDDYLDPPEEYSSVPFGGHGQGQGTGACYASLPSLHGLGLLASRHVMHHAPPTHIPVHASHTPLNMHTQMPSSLTTERRSFIGPWLFDCSQRVPTQDPANVSLEAGAEEPMDISRPASPPMANSLHHVSEAVIIDEAFASVAQTETHVNANAEEPSVVGAYPGSPVRSAIVSPWEDAEEIPQLETRQQQECLSQPQGQLESAAPAAEDRTGPSSVIVEASEGSEKFAEDVASDVDADGEADVDPTPTAGAITTAPVPLEPVLPLVVPAVHAVPQSFNAPPDVSAGAAPGTTIDARLTSLDKALVNLWSNVLRMQIAHRKTQTDHKMLSDRTDALAARVDAVQADLRGAMRGDNEVDALRTRVHAAEDLLSQLQGRLSATEVAVVLANAQAEAQATEQAAQMAMTESDAALATTMTTAQSRKRKRTEDDAEVNEDGNNVDENEDKQGDSERARLAKAPPKKRTRRYARAAVHTAAAVVVGAVAAWSALAFV